MPHDIPTCSAFGLPYEKRWLPSQVQECVDLFELNEKQTAQLWELKDRLSDRSEVWSNGPFEVARFVLEHTCQGDVDIMEKRIRKACEWREENGLDTILETFTPPNLIHTFPAAIMEGTDRDGDVLCCTRQGDPLGILQRVGKDEMVKSLMWGLEFIIRGPWQRKHGRPKRATAVVDLRGLNRRHYHPSLLVLVRVLANPIQSHYPYVMKKVLVINAPALFRFVWTIIKPFVLPHLRALMEVATEAESKTLMEKYVDLKELPDIFAPRIGKGKHVEGLNPRWDTDEYGPPPPSPDDMERPPLTYGPAEVSAAYYYSKGHDTMPSMMTASGRSSFSDDEETNDNLRQPIKSTVSPLMKGNWIDQAGIMSIQIR